MLSTVALTTVAAGNLDAVIRFAAIVVIPVLGCFVLAHRLESAGRRSGDPRCHPRPSGGGERSGSLAEVTILGLILRAPPPNSMLSGVEKKMLV